jgi:hypothetical protein
MGGVIFSKREHTGGGAVLDQSFGGSLHNKNKVTALDEMRYYPVTFALYSSEVNKSSSNFSLCTVQMHLCNFLPVIN